MERRIEQAVPLVQVAGTDPAAIPGLTPPGAAGGTPAARPAPAEERVTASTSDSPGAPGGDARDPVEPDAAGTGAAEEIDWEAEDAFAFEAADRQGSVAAGPAGVRFRLGPEEAAFRWAEIGAVETGTPRWGRRLTVTVYTTDRRRYEGEVDAPSRSRLRRWETELDAVLDAHFDEG